MFLKFCLDSFQISSTTAYGVFATSNSGFNVALNKLRRQLSTCSYIHTLCCCFTTHKCTLSLLASIIGDKNMNSWLVAWVCVWEGWLLLIPSEIPRMSRACLLAISWNVNSAVQRPRQCLSWSRNYLPFLGSDFPLLCSQGSTNESNCPHPVYVFLLISILIVPFHLPPVITKWYVHFGFRTKNSYAIFIFYILHAPPISSSLWTPI
jgi:hypothetical protein